MFDFVDFVLGSIIVVAVTVVVLLLGFVVVDTTYSIRAQRKEIACYEKRMDAKRVSLTTDVTCIPRSLDTRNDTLTVQSR